jgi:serine/threonine-protein kinase RsbW
MAGNPNVRLRFLNRPENVLLVRQALNGLAEALGIDAVELNDVTTAVTEACNNVVLHAYGGEAGPLEVELSAPEAGLDVIVRDRGTGIRPGTRSIEQVSGGIGLPVIHALAETVELRDIVGGGTEVEMHFATTAAKSFSQPSDALAGAELEFADGADDDASSDTALMSVAPTAVAGSVLPRVLSALAARAYFPTDRITDAQTLTQALLEHVDGSVSEGHLTIAITVVPHSLELRIGPLQSGRADELFGDTHAPGLSTVLERLEVGHEVAPASGSRSEMLAVRLAGGHS